MERLKMRVPVIEDIKNETEEEKPGEEENEEDWVSGKTPAEEVFVPLRQQLEKCVLSFFSAQIFFKPVIEDLRMELAKKCTKLISDVSGLSHFCLTLHGKCGTVMS